MHPIFLNFRDNGLEKKYRNSLLTKILHSKGRKLAFRLFMRVALILRESNRLDLTSASVAVKLSLLVFFALPLLENAIRNRMQREVLYKRWEDLTMIFGILNVWFLTVTMSHRLFHPSDPLVPPQSIDAAAAKIFVLCSGVLPHVFNTWWYTLRFKKLSKLALYTFAVTAVTQTSQACEKLLVPSTLMTTLRETSCLLHLALHSVFSNSPTFEETVQCGASDTHACMQTLVFTNLWVGVVGTLVWAWFSERESRRRFLEGLNARAGGLDRLPAVAERHWWEAAILVLLIVPLAWVLVVGSVNVFSHQPVQFKTT